MKSFKDNTGREWEVPINVASVKRVRELIEVDLLKIIEEGSDLLTQLSYDPVVMVDVIYAICKPQADAKGVTDEQFGEAMGGDSLDGAYKALFEGLGDFFRGPQRGLFKKAIEKLGQMEQRAVDHVAAVLDSDAIDKQLDQALRTHGDSSGSAPESSG